LRFEIGILLVGSAAFLCGCGNSAAPAPAGSEEGVSSLPVVGHPQTPGGTSTIDEAVLTDASAIRLGNILEALFTFFSINKGMPATLDDLH
jgi:hypothetical protein